MKEVKSTGWICPRCKRAISPFMVFCPFCTERAEEERPQVLESREKEETTIFGMPTSIFEEWQNGPKEGGEK